MNSRTSTRLANKLLAIHTGNGRSRQATVSRVAANVRVETRCHQLFNRCSPAYSLLAINNSLPLRIVAFFRIPVLLFAPAFATYLDSTTSSKSVCTDSDALIFSAVTERALCYAMSTLRKSGHRNTLVKSVSRSPENGALAVGLSGNRLHSRRYHCVEWVRLFTRESYTTANTMGPA